MLEIYCSPHTEDVEDVLLNHINIKTKVLHLVPTMILYRRRYGFYKKCIPSLDEVKAQDELQLNEFNRFIRREIYKKKYDVLSNKETSVLLERLLRRFDRTNHLSWRSVIPRLTECFFKLVQSGLTLEQIRSLDQRRGWQTIVDVYTAYLEELNSQGVMDLGQAYIQAINDINPGEYKELYLDGAFTPILSHHHRLIIRFLQSNQPVKCFIPFDLRFPDHPALRVLRKTYESYLPIGFWQSIRQERHSTTVHKIAESIFHGTVDQIEDLSFQMRYYSTLEEEVRSIVEEIADFVKYDVVSPRKVAIVTPNVAEMRPMVRELAELNGLKTEAPLRPVVQLPQGRAIHTLYRIYTDDRNQLYDSDHYIDAEMVQSILYSRFFKHSEHLPAEFEKIKVFFEDCRLFSDWEEKLNQLVEAKSRLNSFYRHHPLWSIKESTLQELRECLINTQLISRRLIQAPEQSFDKHVQFLIDVLDGHSNVHPLDEEIRFRLENIQRDLTFQSHITINAYEFARRIQSILTDDLEEESDNLEEVSGERNKGNQRKKRNTIMVTGPNNVEYQKYDYIYVIRFTENMFPETVSFEWPLDSDIEAALLSASTYQSFRNGRELERYYLDRSLYHFYIVLNATSKKLTISYAEIEDGMKQNPSHYLYDIARVLNVGYGGESVEDQLKKYGLLKKGDKLVAPLQQKANEEPVVSVGIGEVSIEELAIYDYCPRRFYYEKYYPEERIYKDIFHLQHYAASCLYSEAVLHLVERYPHIYIGNRERISHDFHEMVNRAEKTIKPLFAMPDRYWEDVRQRTINYLHLLVDFVLAKTPTSMKAKLEFSRQMNKKEVEGIVFTGERQLKIEIPQQSTLYLTIMNFRDLLSFKINVYDEKEDKRLKEIKDKYHRRLSALCRGSKEVDATLAEYARRIKRGIFSKNAGAHCQYCPFHSICKEREIRRDAIN